MRRAIFSMVLLLLSVKSFCWGFYAHKLVNYYAVFLLPPEMLSLYKKHIQFINDHAVDPDKRRYAVPQEGARHYIDMDHYGRPPYDNVPRTWKLALARYPEDSLNAYGIVPWWIPLMLQRLTMAFKAGDPARILKLSAELGHYVADSHVPLHASSNHNGQFTHQEGIHGFWESRVPELLAEKEWDFVVGKAMYIKDPVGFTWKRVLESAAESDSVLFLERRLSADFPPERKFAFEPRSGLLVKQYSSEYTIAYNTLMNDMVERRLRQSIFAVASFWYTAWVNAGRPELGKLADKMFSDKELKEFNDLDDQWRKEGSREEGSD